MLAISLTAGFVVLRQVHAQPQSPQPTGLRATSGDDLAMGVGALIAMAISVPIALTFGVEAGALAALLIASVSGVYGALRMARRMTPPPSRARLLVMLAVAGVFVLLLAAYVIHRV